jgi:hypothetical protein
VFWFYVFLFCKLIQGLYRGRASNKGINTETSRLA